MPNTEQFNDIIQKYASAYGIDPDLIKAHISVESNFNPKATANEPDGTKSYGLMQINDKKAQDYGVMDKTKLYDPDYNISIGARIMARDKTRYGENVDSRISAYNAGTAFIKPDGRYANQGYVDKVKRAFQYFKAGTKTIVTSPITGKILLILGIGIGVFFLIQGLSKKGKTVNID